MNLRHGSGIRASFALANAFAAGTAARAACGMRRASSGVGWANVPTLTTSDRPRSALEVMVKRQRGFTLIELMVVVLIIGILAAISIPNFVAMRNRANEGATKANMHTFQLAAEDYAVQNDGRYAPDAALVAVLMPGAGTIFENPFDHSVGVDASWENRTSILDAPNAIPGITSYADSSDTIYNIKGYGKDAALTLVLTSGQ